MILTLAFLFGLIVGSFLNVVIFRLGTKESFLFNRSHCRKCGTQLQTLDLIPVFSFIYLRGRCRYCLVKLSWQYPAIELFTGLIFAGLVWMSGGEINLSLGLLAVLVCFLIVIAIFDLRHLLILDTVVFAGVAVAVLRNLYLDFSTSQSPFSLDSHLVLGLGGALIISGFFFLQYFFSDGRWIGFGDVKFGLLLGNLFGITQSLIFLVVAYVLGGLIGIGLLLFTSKKMSSRLPFGLFLSFSAIIMLLFGQELSGWYLRLIGL
jgi:leader peptidase (prepilin peptidase)/N-methyltransferase